MPLSFSLFEGDGGIGDNARTYDPTGSLLRDVELRIDGSFQSFVPVSYNNNAAGVRDVLEGKGWIITSLTDESTAWFPGLSSFNFRVAAVVGTNYTDRQIQDQLRLDLSGFFNVTGISTISPPWSPVIQGGNVADVTVHYGTTPAASTANISGGTSDYLNSFASGLGISTPIALLGGAVILLWIFRK